MPQRLVVFLLLFSSFAFSQTADELIAKNIQAKGGMDKIKAIKTVRMTGKLDAAGGFTGLIGQENMRPSLVRENITDLGSYKAVGGVMFPFSVAGGPKNDPSSWQNVTYKTIEVNVSLANSDFALPASLKEAPKKQETAKN